MPKLIRQISTTYNHEHLFNIVANIEAYPEFLPWCTAARIIKKQDNLIIAELMIKYKVFRSAYTSRVILAPKDTITVELVDGPFKHLKNHWHFVKESTGSTIEFMLDFELKSSFLENLISSEFDYYADKLMAAFINRAGDNLVNKL